MEKIMKARMERDKKIRMEKSERMNQSMDARLRLEDNKKRKAREAREIAHKVTSGIKLREEQARRNLSF